jgi:hypothetical protein
MWLFALWSCISVATFEAKRPAEAAVEIPQDHPLSSIADTVSV